MSYRFMVTQLMEHEGIAKHSEKAVEAWMKEYAQLEEFKVFLSRWMLYPSARKKKLDPSEY